MEISFSPFEAHHWKVKLLFVQFQTLSVVHCSGLLYDQWGSIFPDKQDKINALDYMEDRCRKTYFVSVY